jgi:glutamyl-tRNA synthetase
MTVTVRFAPSPTGLLHVGNARVALVNWLFARRAGGRFVLRFDDTDLERSKPEYVAAIREDLEWLGLSWDREEHQSARLDRYAEAAGRLKAAGRLYACYETAEELEFRRKRQLGRGLPPVYDRAALKLSDTDRQKLEAEGRVPHWRFKLDHEEVRWDDLVHGPSHFHGAHLSDPVLIRGDGTILYTLSSVVDDIDMGVSHILRGEDHLTNTAVQIQLFQALGATAPVFGHLSLLTDAAGQGLSKRTGSASLRDLRAAGIEPMAVTSLLARLGTADPVRPCRGLDEVVEGFDLSRFGRAAARFDPVELEHLNARILHDLPWEEAAPRLAALGVSAEERLWLAVRGNLARLGDAATWVEVCTQPLTPVIEDAGFLQAAALLLPAEPWDDTTWGAWTASVKDATGRKGKALFHPLRLALTGREHGPELKLLLPLIGRARSEARLSGRTS